jgi:hypothetical protein
MNKHTGGTSRAGREKDNNPNYLLEVLYCFERRYKKKRGALHYMAWFGGKGLDLEEA